MFESFASESPYGNPFRPKRPLWSIAVEENWGERVGPRPWRRQLWDLWGLATAQEVVTVGKV
jgi:hypothetical protein